MSAFRYDRQAWEGRTLDKAFNAGAKRAYKRQKEKDLNQLDQAIDQLSIKIEKLKEERELTIEEAESWKETDDQINK